MINAGYSRTRQAAEQRQKKKKTYIIFITRKVKEKAVKESKKESDVQ